jgi:tetratricopeptide (TPR) repeat protein
MTLALPVLLVAGLAAIPLPSFVHLPVWAERWLWNPRERTAEALAQEQPEAAVRPLESAARLAPEDPLVQFNAGAGHLAAGDARGALPYLEKAAETAPAPLAPAAHYDLGSARLGAGDAAGAVEALKQALRLDPASADAKHNLELALRQLDKERQARRPREAPGGGQQGEKEQSQDRGQGGPDDRRQPESPDPQNPDPSRQGEQRKPQGGPADTSGQPQSKALENFAEQPDMSAQQAAAVLEAVENLERQQRKAQTARRARRGASGDRDW